MEGGKALETPLDIAEGFSVVGLILINSDSSSDGEGVGGKYSKWGESTSRLEKGVFYIFGMGGERGDIRRG